MTGKQLKDLVSTIPDDAEVEVEGTDGGGYDSIWCKEAQIVTPIDPDGVYRLEGVEEDE
jgi:hypothetical protein